MCEQQPVSMIFLAYNEAATIEQEVRNIHRSIISKLPGSEFIVAEDGSIDGTSEILQELSQDLGITHLSGGDRKGYSKALIDAVGRAKCPYVFFADTGQKYDPDDFWKLYEYREDYDLVVGRRTNRKDQLFRRILTRLYNQYISLYFNEKGIRDADSGFKLFNKKVVDGVFKEGLCFRHFVGSEIVLRSIMADLKYLEVPVAYYCREGSSRGLPTMKIPRLVVEVLGSLRELKGEFRRKTFHSEESQTN